jgi:FixJ family two-component response regulator
LLRAPVIAIIDDDASVRTATDRLVRSLGYVALTFSSAADFLQSPHVDDTACVIADVQMPGMSGVELQSHLSAQGCSVPMILITAYPEESVRSRAMKAGAVCFLSKPFDGPVLIECIALALKQPDDGTVEHIT